MGTEISSSSTSSSIASMDRSTCEAFASAVGQHTSELSGFFTCKEQRRCGRGARDVGLAGLDQAEEASGA